MRLPNDKDDWTLKHVKRAVQYALRRFQEYENKVDFSLPDEQINKLYAPYLRAKQEAEDVAAVVGGPYAEEEIRKLA